MEGIRAQRNRQRVRQNEMAGICGWWGPAGMAARSVIEAMAAPLTRFDQSRLESTASERFVLAAAGVPATSALVEHRGVRVAVYGHPFWRKTGAREPREIVASLVDRYLEEGERALQWLGGDFVISIVNPQTQSCLLAVDRIGVRSLVYEVVGSGIVFGSTCDAVLAHPRTSRAIDPQQIYNYVYFHMVPGPDTIYRGQRRILPGHYVCLKDGDLRTGAYWEMQFDDHPTPRPFADMKGQFMNGLSRAVGELSLPQACGAFLSGGTDSSTISGLLGKMQGTPAQTYSIGFEAEGYDEMEYARIAARHFATQHHEYYVTPDDVVDTIPRVAAIYDQPFGNASAIPTYHCARVARANGVMRMLAGDGGDELYGGNARYAKQGQLALYDRLPALLRHGLVEPAARCLPQNGPALLRKVRSYVEQASVPMPARYEGYNLLERLGSENVFTAEFLSNVDLARPHAMIAQVYDGAHASHWLNRVLAIDLKFTLADNDLPKVTRMCELAGMDVAFPMLHEDVVEFSARLAPELKLKGTRLRYFFKEALRGFLPDEILTKQKHGFGLPVGPWLQSHSGLHRMAEHALESLKGRHIVRPEFLDALFQRYLKEHASYYGTLVWVLMMLELWFQQHGDAASGGA